MKKLLWMVFLLLGYSLVRSEGPLPESFKLGGREAVRGADSFAERTSVMSTNRLVVDADRVDDITLKSLAARGQLGSDLGAQEQEQQVLCKEKENNTKMLCGLQKFFTQIIAYLVGKK